MELPDAVPFFCSWLIACGTENLFGFYKNSCIFPNILEKIRKKKKEQNFLKKLLTFRFIYDRI